jgi:Leucine-rich repeat (LRR) protein
MRENDIFDMATGKQRSVHLFDTNHGTLCNGLLSLPKEIKNLKKLEYLYIANSEIASLPAELAELESCTDIEIYNCPNLKEFPMAVCQMPELISLNISNNAQWSAEEVYKGMNGLATGPSREKIQILYARQNKLKEIPESFKNMKKIGLLDLAYNKIEKLPALGKEIAPVQLYLDNNNISELPRDAEGYFCGYDDAETLSFRFNKLTKVPNIFSANSLYTIASVDFSGNQITGFEGEEDGTYKGIKVNTFTLSQNPIEKYPTCLAESGSIVSYIILRACKLNEIPKGSFEGDKMIDLMSLDLSYNYLTDLPREMHAGNMPYLYGIDLSFNSFSHFPYEPLDSSGLTVFALRSQRDENGRRTLKEWPTGIFQHSGLRGLYLGSNDLRKVDDTISTLIYYLDISDNPNIIFDAADICYAWMNGAYILIYDKTQNILNCSYMLE